MDVETEKTERGYMIYVETDQRVALSVKTGFGEKIYLPGVNSEDSSYYVEDPLSLEKSGEGYQVHHTGNIESIEIIS